jgi:hypothetical protein
MLSNSEKEKIKLEEIYREEIKLEISRTHKTTNNVLLFLNSNLGIFILSSIILGGMSFTYTEWRTSIDEKIKLEQQFNKNSEIKLRLKQETLARINSISKLEKGSREYESKNIWIAFWGESIKNEKELPFKFKYYNQRSLFTKYQNWTLFEVLAELKNHEEQEDIKSSLEEVLTSLNENIEHLYGGVYMKTKTNKNIFLPRGKYHPKHKIYVTSKNDKIKIFPEDLPLINYFYSSNQQKELVKKIINLKFLLSEKE